jgi:hypothetical protein
MSLNVKPIDRSTPFTGTGAAAAGVKFVETDKPPPGWYHCQVSAISDDTAHPANLELLVGNTPFGLRLPTASVPVVFELLIQLRGATSVALRAIATSAGGKFIIATIVMTLVEAPPAAAWSYQSRGIPAP